VLFVNAAERAFDVWLGSEGVKRIPIKGLQGAEMPLDQYITLMRGAKPVPKNADGNWRTEGCGN